MQSSSERIKPFMPFPTRDFVRGDCACALLDGAEFFSHGGAALARAIDLCKPRKLWLPHYFCPKLIARLSEKIELNFYEDLPTEASPRFDTLSPKNGDAVLVVNCFGLGNMLSWQDWKMRNQDIVLIEDHSHAPFSRWALESFADFKFASLRKVLPLPDGAYLKMANIKASAFYSRAGAMTNFAATALSAASLDALGINAEKRFYEAEGEIISNRKISRMSAYSLELLHSLDLKEMAEIRKKNTLMFVESLKASDKFKILLPPSEADAFDFYYPVVSCVDSVFRDRLYARLREEKIFVAIYWGSMPKSASVISREESARLFVIPLDFRHDARDIEHLTKTITDFAQSY